jgi:hypothetical protein
MTELLEPQITVLATALLTIAAAAEHARLRSDR